MPGMTRKTGAALRLMPTEHDTDASDLRERETLPPPAPMPARSPLPADATALAEIGYYEDPETWKGYDESRFLHRATKHVVQGMNLILQERQAKKQEYDIEEIVQRQRVLFEDAIGGKLDRLGDRVSGSEDAVKKLEARIKELEEKFKAEVARLETEIQIVRTLAAGQRP